MLDHKKNTGDYKTSSITTMFAILDVRTSKQINFS